MESTRYPNEADSDSHLLTEYEGFCAMRLFVKRFIDEAGNDLATFLGDTRLVDDGMPFDLAAWTDWQECVRQATGGRLTNNEE